MTLSSKSSSVLDVESMMAQGATKKRFIEERFTQWIVEKKWKGNESIKFCSTQFRFWYIHRHVFTNKNPENSSQSIFLNVWWPSLVTGQDWRVSRRRMVRPWCNFRRSNRKLRKASFETSKSSIKRHQEPSSIPFPGTTPEYMHYKQRRKPIPTPRRSR